MKSTTFLERLDELALANLEKLYCELSLGILLEDNTALSVATAMMEVDLAYWTKFNHHCKEVITEMLVFAKRQIMINSIG